MIQECSKIEYRDRVQRMADMIWQGSKAERPAAGICRFCGCELPVVYSVSKKGKIFDVKRGDTNAIKRVDDILAKDEQPADMMIFPQGSCEVMCEEGLYREAQREILRRRERWRISQQQKKEDPGEVVDPQEGMGELF